MRKSCPAFERLLLAVSIVLITVCANCLLLLRKYPIFIPVLFILLAAGNLLPLLSHHSFPDARTHVCNHGNLCLQAFVISTVISAMLQIAMAFFLLPADWKWWLLGILQCYLVEVLLFWNGMLCVYFTSLQLGIKYRALGIACGMIPVLQLVMLFKILRITAAEVDFECEKHRIDLARKGEAICRTKYPLLLVHGVFFRDNKHLNYWGRIPKALEKNGAVIYYGEHGSAASVKDSAAELSKRIRTIVQQTGCEKVNIIAHSKGGLDCRYAIQYLGITPYVASLTTVNTPHRGCQFADYLLQKIPQNVQEKVAGTYNKALRKFGEKSTDFMAAVTDLTAEACVQRDKEMTVPADIYCQSVGSQIKHAINGKFPLNFSFYLVNCFDGPNDGLVGIDSFAWGENFTFLNTNGNRGISHGDIIDLNRENIPDFDVREFYVKLVSDLKERGL